MPRSIKIYICLGDPVFGLWCPYCLLPSGYEIPVHRLSTSGVTPMMNLRKCHDCDRNIP